jgi:hypothetical protein
MPCIDTDPDLPDPTRSGSTTLIQGVSKSAYGMRFFKEDRAKIQWRYGTYFYVQS